MDKVEIFWPVENGSEISDRAATLVIPDEGGNNTGVPDHFPVKVQTKLLLQSNDFVSFKSSKVSKKV